MARDPVSDRFAKRQQQQKLADLAKRARTREELEAETELVRDAKKVEPLRADEKVGRNDPCPCGSGRKYKKCCFGKDQAGGGVLGAVRRMFGRRR